MPKKALESLTESMFYTLMALCVGPLCGIEIADWVEKRTAGACRLGPATLYTILAKFEKERYIAETEVEGRKRTYRITDRGREALAEEALRLRRCVRDAAACGLYDLSEGGNDHDTDC